MNQILLDNNEAFKEILLATSILSNNSNPAWVRDSSKLINFICKAYEIDDLAPHYIDIVTKQIDNLSLINEYKGLKQAHQFDDEYTEMDSFYDLKGKTLLQLATIDSKLDSLGFPFPNEFTYDTNSNYLPSYRFDTILKASSYGDIQMTCQIGLMYATGVGYVVDYDFAIIRLKQAAFWGYVPALKYLAHIYEIIDDEENAKLYKELYNVSHLYFYDGIPSIPESIKDMYSEKTNELFLIITSIYQDIVVPNGARIDYAFLEVMFSEKIPNTKKLHYVNNYRTNEWKSAISTLNKNLLNL